MMYVPYFGQNLESKKKVVGILAHVCLKMLAGLAAGPTGSLCGAIPGSGLDSEFPASL